ncbi:MAG: hypothetical protein R2681_04205 [Pyrinomonadaceae bacterium]
MYIFNKSLLIAVLLVLSISSSYAQNKISDKTIKTELVGVWQDAPSVGSGMSDNYRFFADGTYKFNYNEMDAAKRLLSHEGKWSVAEGKLVLVIDTVVLLIGGKLVEATGSAASEFEIEGGEVIRKKIMPAEKLTLGLGAFLKEELHNTTTIGDVKYWKLSSDPDVYGGSS